MERTRHMSSAQAEIFGSRSDNSIPHWPYGLNTRGLASTAAVDLMKASLRSLVSEAVADGHTPAACPATRLPPSSAAAENNSAPLRSPDRTRPPSPLL